MSEQLLMSDSVQEWLDKINHIIDLPTVDASFKVSRQDIDSGDLSLYVGSGILRKSANVVNIPGANVSIVANNTTIIGIDTVNLTIAQYTSSNVPTQDFVPLYEVDSGATTLIGFKDLRTWAIAVNEAGSGTSTSGGDGTTQEYVDQEIQNHLDASDPHPQYALVGQQRGTAVQRPGSAYFDASEGTIFDYAFSSNEDIILICPNDGDAYSMTLFLQGGNNYTPNWPSSVTWLNNEIPELAARCVVSLVTPDSGETWIANYAGSY